MIRFLLAASLAVLVGWAPSTQASDKTVILVAKRQLNDPLYKASVLVVRPMGGDQHVGVIINRPTKMTLGQLFPEHKPSQMVRDPVYLGGPSSPSVIFALVNRPASPGGKSLRLLPELYMAFETATVDSIIEKEPKHARFVAGLVAWQPGELRDEIRRGAWHVMDADPSIVLRKPEGLWEELVRRAELRAKSI
ncbi:MAG TPA: YqgE/AlgH family protein [Burkholderiales bacterium]|nr:YqgE/AlgH family protein [Burkholderiales bacterium]